MSYISIDVETDGPIQGKNSIVCFGAVVVEPSLEKIFYGQMKPISDIYNLEALAISGFSREEHLTFDEPEKVMKEFANWLKSNSKNKPIFIADNNGYDAAWINWYFYVYCGNNPFGWSSRRIGDIWCGFNNDMYAKWKYFRKTKHTHNPVNDAMGNAEALIEMQKRGLNIKLI
jgi:hypothetical protein